MLQRLLAMITLATRVVVVGLGLLTVTTVALEVFFRYVVERSLFFSDELARYLFIWVSFLAASLGIQRGQHVGMEALYAYLPKRLGGAVRAVAHMLVGTFLIAFLVSSTALLPDMWDQYTTTLGIRIFWVFLALPVGSLLMLVQLLPLLLAEIARARGVSGATVPRTAEVDVT